MKKYTLIIVKAGSCLHKGSLNNLGRGWGSQTIMWKCNRAEEHMGMAREEH